MASITNISSMPSSSSFSRPNTTTTPGIGSYHTTTISTPTGPQIIHLPLPISGPKYISNIEEVAVQASRSHPNISSPISTLGTCPRTSSRPTSSNGLHYSTSTSQTRPRSAMGFSDYVAARDNNSLWQSQRQFGQYLEIPGQIQVQWSHMKNGGLSLRIPQTRSGLISPLGCSPGGGYMQQPGFTRQESIFSQGAAQLSTSPSFLYRPIGPNENRPESAPPTAFEGKKKRPTSKSNKSDDSADRMKEHSEIHVPKITITTASTQGSEGYDGERDADSEDTDPMKNGNEKSDGKMKKRWKKFTGKLKAVREDFRRQDSFD